MSTPKCFYFINEEGVIGKHFFLPTDLVEARKFSKVVHSMESRDPIAYRYFAGKQLYGKFEKCKEEAYSRAAELVLRQSKIMQGLEDLTIHDVKGF